MEFKESQAIYLQIADYVCEQILIHKWKEGDRILSVRELGVILEVNPNTAMRAYDFLLNKEIVFNKRGIGYFVADDAIGKIQSYRKQQFLEQDLPLFFKNLQLLQIEMSEIMARFEQYKSNSI